MANVISPSSSAPPTPLSFKRLPEEIVLLIFLEMIKMEPFTRAVELCKQVSLVSYRFKRIVWDSKVISVLLSKGHLLPLRLTRKLSIEKHPYLLSRTYEGLLTDSYQRSCRLSRAISFLHRLSLKERGLITSFDFTGSRNIVQKGWEAKLKEFFQLLPRLKSIHIPSTFKGAGSFFKVLSNHGAHITVLKVQSSSLDLFLSSLHYHSPSPNLYAIHINHCPTFTNASLEFLLSRCKGIGSLTFVETKGICLEKLNYPKGFKLKRVFLRGENFGINTVRFLIQHFPELEELGVASTNINRGGIREILTSTLPLRELDLSHLSVTEEDLLSVSHSIKEHLESLILYGCKRLSEKSVLTFMKLFPRLKYLDVRYCDYLTIPSESKQKVKILS